MTTNEDGEEIEETGGAVGNIPDLLGDSMIW